MADLTGIPWNEFPEQASPVDQVSKNFKFYELTRSDTAARRGIANDFPSVQELRAAVYLCREVIQPVRDKFGRFSPNSVFRGHELERALKGRPDSWTSTSQHTRGEACDIEVAGVSTMELARWVQANLAFDQTILECYNAAAGPNSGWVHVSVKPPGTGENRGKVLSYVKDLAAGRYVYVDGLQESALA